MTREGIEAWVHSLRPGDEVAVGGWGQDRTVIGIVTKVTPSGIVRTENHGSYKLKNCTNISGEYKYVHGLGTFNHIEPWTPGLYEIAKSNTERFKREMSESKVILKAKDVVYAALWGHKKITYEQAVKLIAIFEGSENGETD